METKQRSPQIEDNVELEHMNNFYMSMPEGAYRYSNGDGFMDAIYDANRRFLSQPEGMWPPDEADLIRSIRKGFEVQKAIDEFLAQEPRIAGWWEDWSSKYPQDLNDAMRRIVENEVLRPVYVAMRERFSQRDLIS